MIFKNALICDKNTKKQCDLEIKNGKICALDSALKSSQNAKKSSESEVIDAKDKIIMPQFIDLNVFPKNKTLSRKSLTSIAKKAQSGGVGIIALNSDTTPRVDSEVAIEFIKSINSDLDIEILPLIASTNEAQKICDISIMHALGGAGICLCSNSAPNTIDKIAKYAKMLEIPLFINADDNLGGDINYGEISAELGLPARNPLSEIKEVAKILEVAIFYNIKVVFSAISEKRSVELIKEAKKLNPNIFCEVSLHHLLLSDEACQNYNTSAKIFPPLKDKKTQEFLLTALQDGDIDLLTSLQCACYNSKKEQVFSEAEFGIDAMAYYFSLLFSGLVEKNIIDLQTLSKICTSNPERILGLESSEIKKDSKARLMLIDTQKSYQIKDSFLPYNSLVCRGIVEKFI